MTTDRDLDRLLDRWMEIGPTDVADRVIARAMTTVQTTPQRGGRWLPGRILAMSTQIIARPQTVLVPAIAACLVLLLAGLGAYLAVRPDAGIGDASSGRLYAAADAHAIAEALGARSDLTAADVPPSAEFMVSGSAAEALHVTMGTSRLTHSGNVADEERRIEIMTAMYAGLKAAETRFFDAVDASGTATPVTARGGGSIVVIAATYAQADAAASAFAGFVAAYETWGFSGTEPWTHGDESVSFAPSPMDRAHARCAHLGSTEPCATAVRTWREGNLVVTVIQQGDPSVSLDSVVATIEDSAAD